MQLRISFHAVACFFVMLAIVISSADTALATSVKLNIIIDIISSTWTVTALASDAQQLGLADWSIDVLGNGGVSILKASTAAQTNQTPSAIFSQLRSTGTINDTNLTGIDASQDIIDATNNNDDSGASGGTALMYGYGFNGIANGQFTSNLYGFPGPVAGMGPITLAKGRFSYTTLTFASNIVAMVSPSTTFQFFPLNYDVDDFPTPNGASLNVINASAVVSSQLFILVPEPASVVLFGCGGLGLAAFVRRRSAD